MGFSGLHLSPPTAAPGSACVWEVPPNIFDLGPVGETSCVTVTLQGPGALETCPSPHTGSVICSSGSIVAHEAASSGPATANSGASTTQPLHWEGEGQRPGAWGIHATGGCALGVEPGGSGLQQRRG